MNDREGRISAELASEIAIDAFTEAGLSRAVAVSVAGILVETSLRGVDSHGLTLLPQYLDELARGVAKADPHITIVRETVSAVLFDADGALGIVAGLHAVEHLVRRAGQTGIAIAAVRNSNHFGAASVYTRRLAEAGLIGLAFSSAASRVAPFGGVHPLFGTNPLSVAAGADEMQFCLDMATSQVSFGQLKLRAAEARPFDAGWANDVHGATAYELDDVHALAPLGGYKGQGLATAVTLLSAVLSAAPLDWELEHIGGSTPNVGRSVGHSFIAIDPTAFGPRDVFEHSLRRLLDALRSSKAAGGGRVVASGDPEHEHEHQRRHGGIPLGQRDAAFFRMRMHLSSVRKDHV